MMDYSKKCFFKSSGFRPRCSGNVHKDKKGNFFSMQDAIFTCKYHKERSKNQTVIIIILILFMLKVLELSHTLLVVIPFKK